MSDEQNVMVPNIEPTVIPPSPAIQTPTPEQDYNKPHWSQQTPQPKKEVPEGWELVNYDDIQDPNIRNSVKKRIDRLYTQLKQHEREREAERQYYRGLEKKVHEIEAKSDFKILEDMADKARTAFDSGNVEEGTKLLREVARAEAILAQKHLGAGKKHVGGQQQPTYQGQQQQASPQFSKEAQDLFYDWQSKHDFAKPGHPYQSQAILTMSNLLVDPNWAHASLEEILDQTAKVMTAVIPGAKPPVSVAQQGTSTKQPAQGFAQQVLGRGQTASTAGRKNTTILDETQKKVARRFFPDLSPDEAFKRYAKNL